MKVRVTIDLADRDDLLFIAKKIGWRDISRHCESTAQAGEIVEAFKRLARALKNPAPAGEGVAE